MIVFCLFALGVAAAGYAETEFACVENGRAVCEIVKTGNVQVDAVIDFITHGIARLPFLLGAARLSVRPGEAGRGLKHNLV